MKLLANKTGEMFLNILELDGDKLLVQFITNEGESEGKPFRDSLNKLLAVGWTHRTTSTAIGLYRFKQGYLEDLSVSFALHRLYPMGRKVKLPSGEIYHIASYANTHADGYYMYLSKDDGGPLLLLKMTPEWKLLPSEKLLGLPYHPKPRTQEELESIDCFDRWAGGF